jgi:hypothetical protein
MDNSYLYIIVVNAKSEHLYMLYMYPWKKNLKHV